MKSSLGSKLFVASVLSIIIIATWFSFNSKNIQTIIDLKHQYAKVGRKGDIAIKKKIPKSWIPITKISSKAFKAIVLSEDWAFYDHHGVDFKQVGEVLFASMTKGAKIRGASTISQQVIKNLFFSNERSYVRKIKEVLLTAYMEQVLNKNKILEIYLNIIEFGKNIYGIKQASYCWS